MSRERAVRALWILVAAAALGACAPARAPGPPAPAVKVLAPGAEGSDAAFPYRALTPTDFRAAAPPPYFAEHARLMGAMTCAMLAAPPELKVAYEHAPGGRGYVARPLAVRYRAVFDPGCSWWNPEPLPMPAGQLLQHEQIHFALIELTARRTNRRIEAIVGEGATPQAAGADFERRVKELLLETAQEARGEQTRFDRETSGNPDPAPQERWWREVSAELERTRP